ncbi:DUF1007 family protein [Rhizobium halophytocola]|uniref:ABC-type uncharacterized transport system substrate-binding protein n=1 Tax=Rhizobium halophytocola TaxID=735519 RepID=A0ABS4E6K6_9HYPH|nr:DUF1007 family protein [Rhizobium halophytocola]MBP1853558.1 ABC-type uncharacterized transport system substrate-binding protein [Rhizobium halophytocola]
MRHLLTSLLVLSLLIALASPASAHPDIAVTTRLLFDMQGGTVVRLLESWTFDRYRSAALMRAFDADRDGQLSDGEGAALLDGILPDLAAKDYFTAVTSAGEPVALDRRIMIEARAENGIVSLAFALPLTGAAHPDAAHPLSVMLSDPSYVMAFRPAEGHALQLRGDDGDCRFSTEDRPADRYFGGLVVPRATVLICR